MKCENCGKNEVTFIYQSNINGQVTEKHLCSECAEKLGLTRQVAARSQRMMRNFFGDRRRIPGRFLRPDVQPDGPQKLAAG